MLLESPQQVTLGADDANPIELTHSPFAVDELQLQPGEVAFDFVTGDNGDGAVPLDDPTVGPITGTIKLRVIQGASGSMDQALAHLQRLALKVADATRRADGLALDFRPANAATVSRLYVVAASITGLPMAMKGDNVGWYHASPVVTIGLTCKPYVYGEQQTVSVSAGTSPRQLNIADVGGDAPAEGTLTITEADGYRCQLVEYGLESFAYDSTAAHDLELTPGAGLTTTGYGASTIADEPVAVGAIDPIDLAGSKRFMLRGAFERPTEARLLWRVGGGAWAALPWTSCLGNESGLLDLGTAFIPLDANGAVQEFEGLIQARRNAIGTVDAVDITPADRLGRAYAPDVVPVPTSVIGYDDFDGTTGNLNGKTADIGGNWTTGGSATDLVKQSDETVTRSTTTDTTALASGFNIEGRIAVLAAAHTAAGGGIEFDWSDMPDDSHWRVGIILRYTNSNVSNLVGWLDLDRALVDYITMYIDGRHTGANFGIGSASLRLDESLASWLARPHRLEFTANEFGDITLFIDGQVKLRTYRSDYATGGAADDGTHVAWFDAAEDGTTSGERVFREPRFYTFDTDAAMYPNNELRFAHDSTLRESEAGTTFGPPPQSSGARVLIPPAGDQDAEARIVTRAFRHDPFVTDAFLSVAGEVDHSASLTFRERYRLPTGA